jgi:HEPN domain-containing protein
MLGQEAKLIRRRIRDAARAYRNRGYKVIVDPRIEELPPFLHGFKPDIVAQKDNDKVIIEVKTQPKLKGSNEIISLAEKVAAETPWRFELIVTNPGTIGTSLAPPEIARVIGKLLSEAELLFKTGLRDAAVVYSFSAVEALIQEIARKHGTNGDEDGFSTILRTLVYEGHIDHEFYQEFQKFQEERNRIVHQSDPTRTISERDIVKIVEKVKAALSETEIAA